ncbi:MAG: archease [Methanocorpusculum sp.]|nr:archease [Methanocorpusculum sp.]
MPFEELEHTADVKMRITASGFSDLLPESGFALAQVTYGPYPRETPSLSVGIEAEGKTREELCVNFLSELLVIMETEYLVPVAFSLTSSSGPAETGKEDREGRGKLTVSGTVSGVEFEREKHAGGIGVKGISYSGLTLRKTETGCELIIIFDI